MNPPSIPSIQSVFDDLAATLRDPEMVALARRVSEHLVDITSRALVGEDVAPRLLDARAQVQNLSVAQRALLGQAVRAYVVRLGAEVVARVLL